MTGTGRPLRIPLVARRDIVSTRTRQSKLLHALLLTGDDIERQLGRGASTKTTLLACSRHRSPAEPSCEQQRCRSQPAGTG